MANFLKTEHSRKVVVGASYLISEKLFKLFVGLLVHALMARYLSPARFGKMGYIINFATAFLPLTLFGLDDLGVKRILSAKDRLQEVIGEIFTLRLIAFGLVFVISGVFLALMAPEQGTNFGLMTWIFCIIYNFIGCFFTLELPYLASVSNRPIFSSRLVGYLTGTGLKLVAIFNKLSFVFLLATYLIEEIVSKTLLFLSYKGSLKLTLRRMSRAEFLSLVGPSFWIVTGSFLLVLEHKMGFLALEKFSSAKSLGFFTAAYMLVDLWTFIPLAIISAVLPSIISFHHENKEAYTKRWEDLHGVFFFIELGFVLSVWVVAPYLIQMLYGVEYEGAERFLRWQSVTVFIMFTQLLRMRWFMLENALDLWTSMVALEALVCTVLVFGWLGDDISGIVLSILMSFAASNIVFSFRSSLVREALKKFLFSPAYVFHGVRTLANRA